jgi:hypothetical protein
MRPRSREAVSGFATQRGFRTAKTASVSISSTGRARSAAAPSVRLQRHCSRCFSFRHSFALASNRASAISPNVGFFADARLFSRRASIGLRPDRRICRASSRAARASASPTPASNEPNPFRAGYRAKRNDRPTSASWPPKRKGKGRLHRSRRPDQPSSPSARSTSANQSPSQSPRIARIIAHGGERTRTLVRLSL